MTHKGPKILDPTKVSKQSEDMLDFFHKEIIGQEKAVRKVVDALEVRNSPLRDPTRPIFTGLFLGPSGVGKTLTAEILAKYLFGSQDALTKIDGANYSQPHEVAVLRGSPPGYVGFKDSRNDQNLYDEDYPLLSQWNIDKHHVLALQKKDQASVKDVKKGKDFREEDFQLALMENHIKSMKEGIAHLDDAIGMLKAIKHRRESHERLLKEVEEMRMRAERDIEKLQRKFESKLEKQESIDNNQNIVVYDPRNHLDQILSVVLFDEIEKGSEELHNLLLEIMDKGRFQLANGRTTSFKNSFVIMTSNIGSKEIAELLSGEGHMGFRAESAADEKPETIDDKIYRVAREKAEEYFRPEFLRRIDEIIVFRPLNLRWLILILDKMIFELQEQLVREKMPIFVRVDQSVKEFLAQDALKRSKIGAGALRERFNDRIRIKIIRLIKTGQLKVADGVTVKLDIVNGKKELKFINE